MLGFALIALMLASRGMLPGWLRWLTLIIGVLAVGAPAYFPGFAIPVWGIVMGSGSLPPAPFRARSRWRPNGPRKAIGKSR
jgi:hypothetical protein